MFQPVKCSRCGNTKQLCLVTVLYSDDSSEGRILVYCKNCREDFNGRFGLTIPLSEVGVELFLALYKDGKTCSDPFTAAEIVFGTADPSLVAEANELIELRQSHR